ncbi:hypothetical protein CKO15_05680 [Halorhodospira abdelmalekii]|uniref:Lcl C-terminal domain-containing protein n=1 Tax=Halorhodospira abdelmalekii TaxID=421629 RepID=UPI0019031BFA|nr:hypothetical protein [Halorhodospira abdelmalekii]
MPTIEELRTLRYCSSGAPVGFLEGRERTRCRGDYEQPTIVEEAFPNTSAWPFWSASSYAGQANHAWLVFFSNGNDQGWNMGHGYRVRLLRDGQ